MSDNGRERQDMSQLPDIVDGVSILNGIGGLIGQDWLQEASSDGWIGIQERRPRGVNYVNRVRILGQNPSVPPQPTGVSEISYPICRMSAWFRAFYRGGLHTPHENQKVVRVV